ncbi:MAG: N-acetyltransferase [Planctomycetota bacterium]|nr:N-acetyltransferase [Planctomycetota bacterium]
MAIVGPRQYQLRPDGMCVVRSATPDDAPGVLECAIEVFRTSEHTLTQADEFTMTLDREREFLAENLREPGLLFLCAFDARDPWANAPAPGAGAHPMLGLLNLRRTYPKRKVRHVLELGMSVRSSHRGRGVGTALMAAAMDWAATQPEVEMVTLGVYAANLAGRALYRRFGFVEYGMLPAGCKHDDGTRWDQVLMVKVVKPGIGPFTRL